MGRRQKQQKQGTWCGDRAVKVTAKESRGEREARKSDREPQLWQKGPRRGVWPEDKELTLASVSYTAARRGLVFVLARCRGSRVPGPRVHGSICTGTSEMLPAGPARPLRQAAGSWHPRSGPQIPDPSVRLIFLKDSSL